MAGMASPLFGGPASHLRAVSKQVQTLRVIPENATP
jgi:hypothetical protein